MPIQTLRTLLAPVLLCSLLCAASLHAEIIDRNVVIVNNDTITLSEINEFGKELFAKVERETPADQREVVMQQARNTILTRLVERRLLIQEAEKLQIQVTDQDIDAAMQQMLKRNKGTIEEFRQELHRMGMTEKQYREDLRDQILGSRLIGYEVRGKVAISEEQVLDYYNNHYTGQADPGYTILQIGTIWGSPLANGHTPTQKEALAKIRKAHAQAQKGMDFGALARQYSDLPSARDNGKIGTFKKHEMAEDMRSEVTKLQPGELSPVMESENGYHFFKLAAYRGAGDSSAKAPFESVKEEIREQLYKEAMEARFKSWMQSIREKAYIRIL
ncbi:MAG: peptidylprolyl isomerase [Desulfobulbus sp.]|jgi:peptidyl-prolyl cis-trans isomerase SurA